MVELVFKIQKLLPEKVIAFVPSLSRCTWIETVELFVPPSPSLHYPCSQFNNEDLSWTPIVFVVRLLRFVVVDDDDDNDNDDGDKDDDNDDDDDSHS